MSENLNNMFDTEQNNATAANVRHLAGTDQLTRVSTEVANSIMKAIEANFDMYKEQVAKSKIDHNAMDALVNEMCDLNTVNVEFIRELDEVTQDLMLKSQQSKRSRSKNKVMTLDNYRSMMVGAIAEGLIRVATGKAKSASGARRLSGSLEYTEEQTKEFAEDQEKLRKEIRNVQSKKSIMKSKEGFAEDDERWLQLLVAEETLKGLRTETKTIVIDETKNKLAEVFSGVDLVDIKNSDAKKLLEQVALLLGNKETEEVE